MNTAIAVHIASNALILLGHNPISDFDEKGAGARVAKNFYESMYRSLLAEYNWNFATKIVKLNRLVDQPEIDYQYQFQLPSDHIRTVTVHPFQDQYEIVGDMVYADAKEIHLEYIYRIDESFLTPMFREAFELYCAAKWAMPVTENGSLGGTYFAMYEKQLKKAKKIDSQEKPNRGSVDAAAIPLRMRQRQGGTGRRGYR